MIGSGKLSGGWCLSCVEDFHEHSIISQVEWRRVKGLTIERPHPASDSLTTHPPYWQLYSQCEESDKGVARWRQAEKGTHESSPRPPSPHMYVV